MSKDIIIQEGGVEKSLQNIGKLKTESLTGADLKWTPAEENQVSDIEIHANGEYRAKRYNRAGFGVVTVNNKKGGSPKILRTYLPKTPNNTVVSIEEGGKKYRLTAEQIETDTATGTVKWVPEKTYSEKNISENGEFYASRDGAAGYRIVNVNITSGGGGGGGDTDSPPEQIRVVTPPDRTTYDTGDTIDYTGMVVKAFKADGSVWSNSNYPNGVIPNEELIKPLIFGGEMSALSLDPIISIITGSSEWIKEILELINPLEVVKDLSVYAEQGFHTNNPTTRPDYYRYRTEDFATTGYMALLLKKYYLNTRTHELVDTKPDSDEYQEANSYIVFGSESIPEHHSLTQEYSPGGPVITQEDDYTTKLITYPGTVWTINGKLTNQKCFSIFHLRTPMLAPRYDNYLLYSIESDITNPINSGFDFGTLSQSELTDIATAMAYIINHCPECGCVKWPRPYDGKELKAKFDINEE